VRDLQAWFIPNLSEDEVLDKYMSEVMVNLLQMQMERKASKARRKYEERQAKQRAKTKS